ncbi:hypothetical protein SMACR_03730 [Sordaria macrospora]|uniref:Uncharacterized protein n=1 Tax=Sordaria macrospora TaxID=5147 RepID=A0A8S8ZF19_SORMA|nr:hypothetical protein SMACR_03730 [Sordaria macrospora]WPJ61633.1 hypothetical protein SMAC4_03730 [Sordaria macrospora]
MDLPSSTERSPLLYHGGFFPTHPPIVKVSDHEQRAAASHQQEVEHQDRISPPESEPWTRPAFLTASLCTSFLILFAIADLLRWVSTTRLLELGICREYYHNHTRDHSRSSNIPIPDSPDSPDCTHPAIQSRLATLRGTLSALEAFLSLCLTLPYGLLVPRIPGGERSLAGLNVLGYLLSCGWLMIVCSSSYRYPDNTFPGGVNTTIWAPVLRVLVGGGAPVLSSLVYAIAARGVPKQKRASVFMVFVGAQLGAGVVGMLGAAALLDRGREMAAMGLNFPLGVGCLVVLWCLPGSRKGERRGGGGGGEGEGLLNGGERESDGDGDVNKHVTMTLSLSSLLSSGKRSTAVLSELLAHDRRVLVLLATIPIAKCINPVEELMVQYIPKRFDISLASVSSASSSSTSPSSILLCI